ncbi:MAG: AraC family transcriptional regulator protein [Rhodoferax sp.]|nr:AraC family transcriptional regulator protein [Rhodoferax sp.]
MSAFDRPAYANTLPVDQLALAVGIHLMEQYSGLPFANARKARSLSASNERRAKEILSGGLASGVSIAAIAKHCSLSRSHFIRAFRETTGCTPHRWLVLQRVERARELMLNSPLSLAEIALVCGFADQSHFTRAFVQIVGLSPGKWRRGSIV